MNKKCAFIGSKELGFEVFTRIACLYPDTLIGCITYDDSNDIRSKLSAFKDYCEKNNINLTIIKKSSELKSIIKNLKPDFCLVIGWYWILDESVLKLCNSGFIGIHASLLPKYRGCSPLVWSLINGEKETGISMFYFDKGTDSGNLISQKNIEILESDYIKDVLEKVEMETLEIIEEQYPLILEGKNKSFKQSEENVSYCSQRTALHGHINWSMSAKQIYNFIRAQSKPYPGAFVITKQNIKVQIYESEIFPYEYYGVPGQIVKIDKNVILVICKHGAINLIIESQYTDEEIKKIFKYGDILM